MSQTTHSPVWNELLDFALASDGLPNSEAVRAALADFGIETDLPFRRVLAAVRHARAGGGGLSEHEQVPATVAPGEEAGES